MDDCQHSGESEKVIDQLGMMRERPDGTVNAPITAWHYRCTDCGAILSRHTARDPDTFTDDVDVAIGKIGHAAHVIGRWFQGR